MISQKTPELPPSQFSDTDPNGLWNYNPFLCGTGLAEALSFLFRYGMTAWDKALVPLSILHLYNMLRDTKSVEPIPLYETLTHVFGKSVFADGKPPKRNFYTSLAASIRAKPKPRSALANKDRVLRGSTHFTDLSVLSMLEEADWIPDRIADEGLPIYSGMGFCRLNNSKPTKDGAEAKPELEDTSFLKMLKASSAYTPELETGFAAAMARDEGYTSRLHPATVGEETESLEFVLMDIRENIEGTSYHGYERITGRQLRLPSRNRDSIPPSGVNYLRLLATMMLAYMVMEKAVDDMEVVKEWKTHLKPGVKMDSASRVTGVAMQTMDEELLKRLGKELKAVTLGVDLSAFMYWSQLEVPSHSTWDRRPT